MDEKDFNLFGNKPILFQMMSSDILVLQYEIRLSEAAMEVIKARVDAVLPGVKVLLIEKGISIHAILRDAAVVVIDE